MNPCRICNWPRLLSLTLSVIVLGFGFPMMAKTETSAAPDNETSQLIQEKGQAALTKIQTLWQRIDERRLKNRTPDQLVAWVIMGLLAGGLLYRFGKPNQIMSVVFGLVGAFIGGILANVSQLDFGWGPVLITYEELLFTLAGGVLMLFATRWSSILKVFKRPPP